MLLDNVQGHAILMIDPDGRVVSWNAGAERMVVNQRGEIGAPFAPIRSVA